MFTTIAIILPLALATLTSAAPVNFHVANGKAAEALNKKFTTLKITDKCKPNEVACFKGMFTKCGADGKFTTPTPCGGGTVCVALPLVLKAGTSVTCDTRADANARIQQAKSGKARRAVAKRQPKAPAACKPSKRDTDDFVFSSLLGKRIAQNDLGAVAESWQKLCLASGGDTKTNDPCVKLAGIDGINALLANGDTCAQQDNADAMITFAKSKGIKNKDALIKNAIAYRQHPRNALNIDGTVPSTLFCQKAPKNAELNDIVNKQLDGVDRGIFGSPKAPLVAFGAEGTCPRGQKPDVNSCSCKGGNSKPVGKPAMTEESTSESPTQTAEAPAQESSISTEVQLGGDDNSTETPVDDAETPTDMTETPADMSETPVDMSEEPPAMNGEEPVDASNSPVEVMTEPTSDMSETPCKNGTETATTVMSSTSPSSISMEMSMTSEPTAQPTDGASPESTVEEGTEPSEAPQEDMNDKRRRNMRITARTFMRPPVVKSAPRSMTKRFVKSQDLVA